ncbi:MAG: STAS domain-containing protein [Planctomycetota bacterium]
MTPAAIEFEQAGCTVVCTLSNPEVSHLEMQEAVEECANLMRNDGARVFILDLSAVEFLASACIGVLVQFMQDLEHIRGRLALVGCQDPVKFLFQVTRLDQVFHLYDDVDEAQAALA